MFLGCISKCPDFGPRRDAYRDEQSGIGLNERLCTLVTQEVSKEALLNV
jgi:hypothetical protein